MIKFWLQMRTQEQRILVLISGIVIITGLWFLLWEGSYQTKQSFINQQIQALERQANITQQKIIEGKKILSNPELMQNRKNLQKELDNLNAQVDAVSTRLVSSSEMVKALKNVLAEDSELNFIRLENTSNTLLPITEKSNKKLYNHNFVLEFTGNYFATLNYLKKLEKLPWHFYIESINYQVTKYPEAKITMKLHTVSESQELMNVA